jgi:hypothetical protein
VTIKEANSIDFEAFFLHLDNGGSIFLTVKPEAKQNEKPRDEIGFKRSLKKIHPELAEGQMDQGVGLSALNWETEEMRSWK